MEEINIIKESVETMILNGGVFTPLFSSLLIIIEAFCPVLPLVVFVSINVLVLGNVFGFIISYILTVLGSYLAFLCSRKFLKAPLDNKLEKTHKYISKLTLVKLALILSLPYTPGSIVNFVVGIGNLNKKDYLISLIIGKFFVVFFWILIGTNIYESITNYKILLLIGLMLIIAYIVSKTIEKNIEKRK